MARGDLGKKITVDVRGEILELKNTINTMVDRLADQGTSAEVHSDDRLHRIFLGGG